ncbi:MAG: acetyl-CoA C-acyltransferase [Bacteroidia bacterium]|nr:acetyl-CoA C-acyltransferase [Bacteroidia bacterium]
MKKDVFIVSAARTAIGSFLGTLSAIPATKLGSIAIKGALDRAGVSPDNVDEVYMGNVLQANEGQAPARQASLGAGIPVTVPCTTVNKVCASGTKSMMFAAQAIQLEDAHIVVAGGMENMSLVPHYLPNQRTGTKFGHLTALDGMLKDGLWDVYNDYHMGNAGEVCAVGCNISREAQDEFAIESYKRSQANIDMLAKEIVPVEIPQRKGDPMLFAKDEEPFAVDFAKIPSLRPVFKKDGTVTAANASTLNDGAAALVLASGEAVKHHNLKPLAKIIGYADAAKAPEWFTTAPADAIPKAIAKAGLTIDDIDFFEINEAFSVVALANMAELGITSDKVNVFGGAVSIGHPLGASGARIMVTLLNVLEQKGGKYGCIGICNGGGGASAMVVERV